MLLLRRISSDEEGTFGELFDIDQKIAVTCERPNNGNQKMGCIPIGDYQAKQFDSPSKGKVFLLEDVPNRSMIEIHKGNTIDDTEGCILVGHAFGEVGGKKGIVGSRATLEQLLIRYPSGFKIRIIEDM